MISDAFDAFATEIVSVRAYQSAIRTATDKEYQGLLEQDKRRTEANLPSDKVFSMQNYFFRTADTGKNHFYGFRDSTIQAQIDALVHRTNRQYQWLLAEAYELFEDFLEKAYACVATKNKGIWPLRDFGSITLDEINLIGFEQLLDLARAKKSKPQSLLNPLRVKIPRIKILETNNRLGENLWFAINFIEKMRHQIVHVKGVVVDKPKFIKELFENIGSYNDGNPDKMCLDLVDCYLHESGETYFISLLDVSLPPHGVLRPYADVLGRLSDYLLAYAHLVATSFESVPSKKPVRKQYGDK